MHVHTRNTKRKVCVLNPGAQAHMMRTAPVEVPCAARLDVLSKSFRGLECKNRYGMSTLASLAMLVAREHMFRCKNRIRGHTNSKAHRSYIYVYMWPSMHTY